MQNFKIYLVSIGFLTLFAVWKWTNYQQVQPSSNIRLHPKIVGKWIVGKNENLVGQQNDSDTIILQDAIDNARSGEIILVRPGSYEITDSPKNNITIRGLTGDPEDVKINLNKGIEFKNQEVHLENMHIILGANFNISFLINNSTLNVDNVKFNLNNIPINFYLTGNSELVSKNNHFIGNKQNTAIFLSDSSGLEAENNKFIKLKNAIETDHGKFNGRINLSNIEIALCTSAGIYLNGGIFQAENININQSASGAIVSGGAKGIFRQIHISKNRQFGLDVLSGSKVKLELFNLDENLMAGIHTSGNESELTAENGVISNSKLAFYSEDQATIKAQQFKIGPNVADQIKQSSNGQVFLSN